MITDEEAASLVELMTIVGTKPMTANATNRLVLLLDAILRRREDERAERAKPIDAEWLGLIGWKERTTHGGNRYYEFGLFAWFNGIVSFCSCKLKTVATRGQLLDLLAAAKGGGA